MSTQPTISRENKDQEGAPGAKRRPTRRAQRTQRPAGGGRPEPGEPEAREPRREQAGPRLRPPADRPPLRLNQVFPPLPQVHCCPTSRGPVIHSHDTRGAPLLSSRQPTVPSPFPATVLTWQKHLQWWPVASTRTRDTAVCLRRGGAGGPRTPHPGRSLLRGDVNPIRHRSFKGTERGLRTLKVSCARSPESHHGRGGGVLTPI